MAARAIAGSSPDFERVTVCELLERNLLDQPLGTMEPTGILNDLIVAGIDSVMPIHPTMNAQLRPGHQLCESATGKEVLTTLISHDADPWRKDRGGVPFTFQSPP
jgi:hypothetical protein